MNMKKFERLRHVRYFSHSLRHLPKQYSSADTTRLTLVHFCVQSLDILGCLPDAPGCCGEVGHGIHLPTEEIVEWIYGLQTLPSLVGCQRAEEDGSEGESESARGYVGGGFKGGTYLGPLPNASGETNDEQTTAAEQQQPQPQPQHPYDHSHLAMTYVAICTLLALGDDLSRINRTAILQTLKTLQKEDGSFLANSSNNISEITTSAAAEKEKGHRSAEAKVEDDCDLRFMYLAVVVWYLLTEQPSNDDDECKQNSADVYINVRAATSYILSCITYDGSIGLTPGREGHGGSTFCGTAALFLLGVLDEVMARPELMDWREDLIRWCVTRQKFLPKRSEEDDERDNNVSNGYHHDDWERSAAGMQGRPNKLQDTCYSYWIGGTLHLLNESRLLDGWALREYVLTCQSPYGGFGKVVGANPDLLHSFYTMCWLAMSREQGCCEEQCEEDDGGGECNGGDWYDIEIRQQVTESIGRLSKLDCALGMCAKRIPRFRKTATMNGNE